MTLEKVWICATWAQTKVYQNCHKSWEHAQIKFIVLASNRKPLDSYGYGDKYFYMLTHQSENDVWTRVQLVYFGGCRENGPRIGSSHITIATAQYLHQCRAHALGIRKFLLILLFLCEFWKKLIFGIDDR